MTKVTVKFEVEFIRSKDLVEYETSYLTKTNNNEEAIELVKQEIQKWQGNRKVEFLSVETKRTYYVPTNCRMYSDTLIAKIY